MCVNGVETIILHIQHTLQYTHGTVYSEKYIHTVTVPILQYSIQSLMIAGKLPKRIALQTRYARAYEAWAALGGQATPKMRHIIQSCLPEG